MPPELTRLVLQLLADRGEAAPRPVLVGIDGRSGSGKTELAARLARSLAQEGVRSRTVHLDDLYQGWDGLAAALEPLCADVLVPLAGGLPGSYRSWDWHRGQPGPRRTVPVEDVVLVEGVGALATGCRDVLHLTVWLEAPAELRRTRALARDGDTFAPHWDGWAAQEDRLYPDGPPRADVVVPAAGSGSSGRD